MALSPSGHDRQLSASFATLERRIASQLVGITNWYTLTCSQVAEFAMGVPRSCTPPLLVASTSKLLPRHSIGRLLSAASSDYLQRRAQRRRALRERRGELLCRRPGGHMRECARVLSALCWAPHCCWLRRMRRSWRAVAGAAAGALRRRCYCHEHGCRHIPRSTVTVYVTRLCTPAL